ncbi:CD166 antigen A-like isoform X1 [Biomphalaria pfeifferi]|uniref:CD166 antigen A-like isoform X1 n=1 Tax=Biomphalaria pfeifferi TaxID=112525 RepID=A0AAD8C691_BIOPF|nr:CD166 antigen A-like isoform X1 [Biomphalaria pfeifferi]
MVLGELWVFFVVVMLPLALAFRVRSSIADENLKEQNAELICSWSRNSSETPQQLFVLFKNISILTCDVSDLPYNCTTDLSSSSKYEISNSAPGLVSFSINNLECSDQGTYSCQIYQETPTLQSISSSVLSIKVPPSVPKLSNAETDVPDKGVNIRATCKAVVGYPNDGQIVWKSFLNGKPFHVDPGLIVTSLKAPEPGDDRCTLRVESQVVLKVNATHQNMTLACFVTNPDFHPSAANECTNPTTDLCSQTNPVNVVSVITQDVALIGGAKAWHASRILTTLGLFLVILAWKK